MRNAALAPMVLLLAVLALAWGGLFGLSHVTQEKETRSASAPAPTSTATPRVSATGSDTREAPLLPAGTATDRVPSSGGRADPWHRSTPSDGERDTDRSPTRQSSTAGDAGADTDGRRTSEDTTTVPEPSRKTGEPAPGEIYTAPADSPAGRDALAAGADADGDSSHGGLQGLLDRIASHDARASDSGDPAGLSSKGAAALILVLLLVAAGSRRH